MPVRVQTTGSRRACRGRTNHGRVSSSATETTSSITVSIVIMCEWRALMVRREALDVLASVRQATLLNAFLAALTRGGPSGLPRPIELHAHDPTRYVGDMLAWVHQVCSGNQMLMASGAVCLHLR